MIISRTLMRRSVVLNLMAFGLLPSMMIMFVSPRLNSHVSAEQITSITTHSVGDSLNFLQKRVLMGSILSITKGGYRRSNTPRQARKGKGPGEFSPGYSFNQKN